MYKRQVFSPTTIWASYAEQSRSTFRGVAGRLSIDLAQPERFLNMAHEEVLAAAVDGTTLRFALADVTDLDPDEAHLVELTFTLGADAFDRVEDYRAPDGSHERTRWRFVRTAAE